MKPVFLIIQEANVYLKMDNKVKFREKMEEAIKLKPNQPDLYYNLGVIYAEVDNNYKARLYYGKAIEIDPNYLNAYSAKLHSCINIIIISANYLKHLRKRATD